MCIKSAPYLDQKVLIVHWVQCFFTFVMMLLTKFVQNCTFRRCSSGNTFFFHLHKIECNFFPKEPKKVHIIHTTENWCN